jgi:hypothetical protein
MVEKRMYSEKIEIILQNKSLELLSRFYHLIKT